MAASWLYGNPCHFVKGCPGAGKEVPSVLSLDFVPTSYASQQFKILFGFHRTCLL